VNTKHCTRINKIRTAKGFVFSKRNQKDSIDLPAISLFSGAGLSDIGYESAGFSFLVLAEKDPDRAQLCKSNFGDDRCVIGELAITWQQVVTKYRSFTTERPALISITPPCQGMSSSNPGRGKISEAQTSDTRNLLLLDAIPVIEALNPRIVVVENVPQLLNRVVNYMGEDAKVYDLFKEKLGDRYHLYTKVAQMADYGVPQDRRRAVLVAINVSEPWLSNLTGKGMFPCRNLLTQKSCCLI
jgi:DNA (cytosine-5)-methyltransferase 1